MLLLTDLGSLFVGADGNGEDLGDSCGMKQFNAQVVKEVGKFARKVYRE